MKTKDYSKAKLLLISILSLTIGFSSYGKDLRKNSKKSNITEKGTNLSTSHNSFLISQEKNIASILNDSLKKEPRQWNNSIDKWLSSPNWNPYFYAGIYDTHATNFINPYIPNGTKRRSTYDQFGNKNPFLLNVQNGNNRKSNVTKIKSPRIKYKTLKSQTTRTKPRSRPRVKTQNTNVPSNTYISNNIVTTSKTNTRSNSRSTVRSSNNRSVTRGSSRSISSSRSSGKSTISNNK